MGDDNPYASPRSVEEPATEERPSPWRNHAASIGFSLSLLFPLIALGGLAALLMEDEFGVVRWRVHRLIRMVLYRVSIFSFVSVAISLAGLAATPRKLAWYGLFLGVLGTFYWGLVIAGVLRR